MENVIKIIPSGRKNIAIQILETCPNKSHIKPNTKKDRPLNIVNSEKSSPVIHIYMCNQIFKLDIKHIESWTIAR